jgi:GNAT superfamily N-acetyltransferase
MGITVRRASADDAAALTGFRFAAQAEDRTSGDAEAFAGDFATWIAGHRNTHQPFLAEMDGAMAGMAWLAVFERVPTVDAPHRLFGDVQSVYVLPGVRGRGVGSALVAAALDEARRRGVEHVTVHSARRAVTLYERAGFRHDPQCLYWNPAS